jgi:hypothetical protein
MIKLIKTTLPDFFAMTGRSRPSVAREIETANYGNRDAEPLSRQTIENKMKTNKPVYAVWDKESHVLYGLTEEPPARVLFSRGGFTWPEETNDEH